MESCFHVLLCLQSITDSFSDSQTILKIKIRLPIDYETILTHLLVQKRNHFLKKQTKLFPKCAPMTTIYSNIIFMRLQCSDTRGFNS